MIWKWKQVYFKLIYCLIFAIIGSITLIWSFYNYLYTVSNLVKYQLYLSDRAGIFISFVTQQTNIIVTLYFWFSFFRNIIQSKAYMINDDLLCLIVTVYISVTGIVYLSGLFPGLINTKQLSFQEWTISSILHLLMPLAMLIYFFWNAGGIYYNVFKFTKKNLYKIYIYPTLYVIYLLIRGELRHRNPLIHNQVNKYGVELFDLEYPYWFLNHYHNQYGIMILIMAIIFIFLLTTLLTYGLIAINNLLYNSWKKKHRPEKQVS